MKNVVEDFVTSLYDGLLPNVPDAHDCPTCHEDVLVFALNRLAPQYVSTSRGEILSLLDVQVGQIRTDATVALMEGFRFVGANPRCGRVPVR